jgi:hypothetical protein
MNAHSHCSCQCVHVRGSPCTRHRNNVNHDVSCPKPSQPLVLRNGSISVNSMQNVRCYQAPDHTYHMLCLTCGDNLRIDFGRCAIYAEFEPCKSSSSSLRLCSVFPRSVAPLIRIERSPDDLAPRFEGFTPVQLNSSPVKYADISMDEGDYDVIFSNKQDRIVGKYCGRFSLDHDRAL